MPLLGDFMENKERLKKILRDLVIKFPANHIYFHGGLKTEDMNMIIDKFLDEEIEVQCGECDGKGQYYIEPTYHFNGKMQQCSCCESTGKHFVKRHQTILAPLNCLKLRTDRKLKCAT
jgi:RecJ-like exonuclease